MRAFRFFVDPTKELDRLAPLEQTVVLKVLFICFVVTLAQGVLSLPAIAQFFQSKEVMFGADFVNYWTSSVLAQNGQVQEIYDPFRFHQIQEDLFGREFDDRIWPYPPHALLLVYPLGVLPYLGAYYVWILSGLALYLFAATGKVRPSLYASALLLAPATIVNVLAGQVGFFTAALFLGGITLVDRRPFLAGVLFGCLTIKPHIGLLIPLALVAGKLWRPFLSASVTTLILVGLSAVLFGLESWAAYFEVVTRAQKWLLEEGTGYYTYMIPSAFMAARHLGFGPSVGYLLQIPFCLFAAWLVYKGFRHGGDRQLQLQLIIVATVIFNPYILTYDLTLLSVAVMLATVRALKTGFLSGEAHTLAAAWFLPLYLPIINYIKLPVSMIILSAFALYLAKRLSTPQENREKEIRPSSYN